MHSPLVKLLMANSGKAASSQESISFFGGVEALPSWYRVISCHSRPSMSFKLPDTISTLPVIVSAFANIQLEKGEKLKERKKERTTYQC